MRSLILWLAAALWIAGGAYAGCAAGGANDGDDGSGGSGAAGGTVSTGGSGGIPDGGLDPDAACAKFTEAAEQAPAAMLIVLDASASMNNSGKWGAAQLAIVGAIDKDVFDSMSLGMVVFPGSFTNPPMCICDNFGWDQATCNMLLAPGVSCGVSALPQIAITPAGTEKSNAGTGVRFAIYQFLVAASPISNSDDGSPIYDALVAGYNALEMQSIDKRILVLITDGGFSCTSLSTRPGYLDLMQCPDWEYPDSVNQLIAQRYNDADKSINTFIVGVPGSDSTGADLGGFQTPPYNMLLALSTYAVSGSPDTVDPACDKDAVFTQGGAAPAVPCHFDLSGGSFDADALANAISDIRGKALGCLYALPEPPPGESINLDQVNVNVTLDGVTSTILRRSDPADECLTDGCWDYTAGNEVEILGQICTDIGEAAVAEVEILVGCETLLK